jgi:hypothetical protein
MLEQLLRNALSNIDKSSLLVMQKEFTDTQEASADQCRPGLPLFYGLLLDLVKNELNERNGGQQHDAIGAGEQISGRK